jgi:hypothetical protein
VSDGAPRTRWIVRFVPGRAMSYANALHDWRLMCGARSSEGAAKRERGEAAMGIHVRTIDDWRRLAREALVLPPFPGGEDFESVMRRVREALRVLSRELPARRLAIVTHRMPIAAAAALAGQVRPPGACANGSITTLRQEGDRGT